MNLKPIKPINIKPQISGTEILIIISILATIAVFLHKAGVIDLDVIVNAGLDYLNVGQSTRKILNYVVGGILLLLICLHTIDRFLRAKERARRKKQPLISTWVWVFLFVALAVVIDIVVTTSG